MMEFSIHHTDEGLKSLYQDWWRRVHGTRNAWAAGMLFFCVLTMLLVQSAAWYLVVPTVAAACFWALVQAIRHQAVKLALEAFAQSGRPMLSFRFDETGLTETSTVARVLLPWTSFAGLAKIGRFWVLYRGPLHNAQFIAFPEHQLPPEALAYLRARLAALERTAAKSA
ncbi:MAG: YcxB family protein [Betaproteobacteria bacterium]|nr:YcxB family protein [Betaproteobacteria bacterium]